MRFWSFGTFALSSRSRLPKHWSDEPLVTKRRYNNIIIFFGSFGHVRLKIFSRNRQKTDAPICFCETPFDYKIIMHNVFVVIKVVFFFFFFSSRYSYRRYTYVTSGTVQPEWSLFCRITPSVLVGSIFVTRPARYDALFHFICCYGDTVCIFCPVQ